MTVPATFTSPVVTPGLGAVTIRPGIVVAALLFACLIKGLATTQGVMVPPDPDTVRDLGFIQGFLDGNWFGDPATADAWRWYPPLIHGLAALIVGGLKLPLLPTWIQAGAWLNLLSPLTFYLMNRRLLGAWPAAAATSVFVLYDSVVMPGDASAGYTPWTLTPALTWPLFFGSVWLIAGRVGRFRLTDAIVVGSALGLVFLAHTVPAVLLSAIVTAAAFTACGPTLKTVRWLVAVAAVQLAWGLPFLLPLLIDYRLHIANPTPGTWVHPALSDVVILAPNLLGAGAMAWLLVRREWRHLPATTVAILAAWIAVCTIFLGRHYACAALGQTGGVCAVFVVAPHHYHVYLQAAWSSLAGLALVKIWTLGRRRDLAPLLVLAALAGLAGLFAKAEDIELRRLGSTQPDMILDRDAYAWILAETQPGDVFVTELPAGGIGMGPPGATVIAAGRRLVAPPEFHANPYVAWPPREAARVDALHRDPCPLLAQNRAGDRPPLFMLANQDTAPPGLVAVFHGAFNTIYRVSAAACDSRQGGSGERGEDLVERLHLISSGG